MHNKRGIYSVELLALIVMIQMYMCKERHSIQLS